MLKWTIVAGTLLELCLLGVSPAQSAPNSETKQKVGFVQESDQVWLQANNRLVEDLARSSFPQIEANLSQAISLSSVENPGVTIDPALVTVATSGAVSQPPLPNAASAASIQEASPSTTKSPLHHETELADASIAQVGTDRLDVKPEVIQESPVLQQWQQKIPDVLAEIESDPSFQTRFRLGYADFSEAGGGWLVGVEDLFVGQTRLTLSGDYQASFDGDQETWGVDGRYYLRPLGRYINLAPVIGYRRLESDRDTAEGVHLGLRFLFVLSRTGAAEIAFTPSWIAPGSHEEAGLTTLSFGYAVTRNLRLSTEFQKQNTRRSKDSRIGIIFEWMF